MFDYHVKHGKAVWLSEQDEIIIADIIADIVKKDKLNILECNICGDHMHILLLCEEEELPKIVGKIKAMTARACNIATGRTIPATTDVDPEYERTRGHVPLSGSVSPDMSEESEGTRGHVPLAGSPSPDMNEDAERTRGHVPLSGESGESGESEESEDRTLPSPEDTDSSSKEKKKKYNPLWTQKFGKRKINGENDLQNVINYIRTNRQKHELPENKKLEKIIGAMSCSVQHAF